MLSHRTNMYLPPEQVEALRRIAVVKGVSMSELVRRAIDEWIERYQEKERAEKGAPK